MGISAICLALVGPAKSGMCQGPSRNKDKGKGSENMEENMSQDNDQQDFLEVDLDDSPVRRAVEQENAVNVIWILPQGDITWQPMTHHQAQQQIQMHCERLKECLHNCCWFQISGVTLFTFWQAWSSLLPREVAVSPSDTKGTSVLSTWCLLLRHLTNLHRHLFQLLRIKKNVLCYCLISFSAGLPLSQERSVPMKTETSWIPVWLNSHGICLKTLWHHDCDVLVGSGSCTRAFQQLIHSCWTPAFSCFVTLNNRVKVTSAEKSKRVKHTHPVALKCEFMYPHVKELQTNYVCIRSMENDFTTAKAGQDNLLMQFVHTLCLLSDSLMHI